MSRSYKKTPVVKDHDSGRWGKQQANRKVRRCKDVIADGKAYRRVYSPWDIHDSVHYFTLQSELKYRESLEKQISQGVKPPYFLDNRGSWEKYYYRK